MVRVILQQDIQNVGRKYEVKEVRDGYARNFLLPRRLAEPAAAATLKVLEAKRQREEHQKSEESEHYKASVEKLKGLVLYFKMKIGERGRAFGSVTAVKIRDALRKQGVAVEKEWLRLEGPIKTTGEHSATIEFPHGAKGEVKVIVDAEG